MRKTFLFFLFLSFSTTSFAQVAFQNISFTDALSKAKSEGKLIFLQLESPDCGQCTEVANKAFADKELSEIINQTFIPFYAAAKHKDRKEIEGLFNSYDGFGTLFIDQNGTLIHKFSGTVSMPQKYREQIDIALTKAGENIKVSQLENEYRKGNKSIGFLEQLLLKKRELNLDNNALLDEYVEMLPSDSLTSFHTFQFIAGMAPMLGSKADITLRKNGDMFNQSWYKIPLSKRVNINSRIIHNSLNKAVREKNEAYAVRVASFARGTVTTTKQAAEKAYYMRLLEFYERTDDVTKYLSNAVIYYDNYVMNVNADSVRKVDEAMRDKLLQTSKKDTIKTETGYTVRSTVAFSPSAQRYTNDLKEGAWNFYKKTSDANLLAKATVWITRGLEFYESYEALDVYARLLYKQKQNDEAIRTEKQAIEIKKKQKFPVKDNETILDLMQKGLPLNDD